VKKINARSTTYAEAAGPINVPPARVDERAPHP
jgi:hypothetical protein